MDALAGYDTSDSDGSPPRREEGLSSLLATYSDASDDDDGQRGGDVDNDRTKTKVGQVEQAGRTSGDTPPGKGEGAVVEGHARKRRRWDSPKATISKDDALPPPTLRDSTTEPYDSLHLFEKDCTVALRRKLSDERKSQSLRSAPEVTKLGRKLEQLSADDGTSFASRLVKSQEFGNPHLLKSVIENYDIDPLKSHLGNDIRPFELADQLMIKEERARIAAANL